MKIVTSVALLTMAATSFACAPEASEVAGPTSRPASQAKPLLEAISVPAPYSRPVPTPYAFSRSEAVERVIQGVVGDRGKRAYHFARDILRREDSDDVVEGLIGYLSKQMLSTQGHAAAMNCIQIMTGTKNPTFSDILFKATDHSKRVLREEAMKALATCADPATIDKLIKKFERYGGDLRAQILCMNAISARATPAIGAQFLRGILSGEISKNSSAALTERLKVSFADPLVPAETIRLTLAGNLGHYKAGDRLLMAGHAHAAGSEEGRFDLLRQLEASRDPMLLAQIIMKLAARVPEASLESVDKHLAQFSSPILRVAILSLLQAIGNKNAFNRIEVLADDEHFDVRRAALGALKGFKGSVVTDRLIRKVLTLTGTKLRSVLEDLQAAEEVRAIPNIMLRLEKARGSDRRIFLQTIAFMRQPQSVAPLIQEFLSEPQILIERSRTESVGYAAILLKNVLAAEKKVAELFDSLDDDPVRQSLLMDTLASYAVSGTDSQAPARRTRIYARLRKVLYDRTAKTQLRIQALHYLSRPELQFSDCVKLRRILRREDSGDRKFRRWINDFLWEMF